MSNPDYGDEVRPTEIDGSYGQEHNGDVGVEEVEEDPNLDYDSAEEPVASHLEEFPEDAEDPEEDRGESLRGAGEELRGASWHLAPSLVRLRNEINARWPRRDKSSDGSIGDAAHSSRTSDHNPNGRRSVNAIDIDKDGIDPWFVVARAINHPSTNYVIFNRQIWSRSAGFRGRRYTGSNPHDKHIHVSIRQTSGAEQSTQGWGIGSGGGSTPTPTPSYPAYPGLLKRGSKGQAVKNLQSRLNTRGYRRLNVDGDFGPETLDRVRRFQRFARVSQDGQVGPVTHKAMWTLRIT